MKALLPPPRYGTCLHLYREKTSAFSSLVYSFLIAPTHSSRLCQKFIPMVFMCSLDVLVVLDSETRPSKDRARSLHKNSDYQTFRGLQTHPREWINILSVS